MKQYRNRTRITDRNPNYHPIKQNTPYPPYPPAPHAQPAVPQTVNNQTGETMIGGIMSSIVQGAALTTGSQIANRTIDSIMGPRKIEVTETSSVNNNCIKENNAYIDCIKNNDSSQCKDFFDLLNKCNNI